MRALRQGIHTHVITNRFAAPLLVEGRGGLIVEITDGDTLGYRQNLFYDLVKISVNRLAYAMAEELYKHSVTALAVTPGYMRTEAILDHFGVTEANWREGARKDPNFIASETPFFVGRAIAALAADARVLEKSGDLYSSWALAREYGFTDIDGSQPDWGKQAEQFGEFPFGPPRTGLQWTLSHLPERERAGRRRGTTAAKSKTESVPRTRRSKGETRKRAH